jgi:hypothetical protein
VVPSLEELLQVCLDIPRPRKALVPDEEAGEVGEIAIGGLTPQ